MRRAGSAQHDRLDRSWLLRCHLLVMQCREPCRTSTPDRRRHARLSPTTQEEQPCQPSRSGDIWPASLQARPLAWPPPRRRPQRSTRSRFRPATRAKSSRGARRPGDASSKVSRFGRRSSRRPSSSCWRPGHYFLGAHRAPACEREVRRRGFSRQDREARPSQRIGAGCRAGPSCVRSPRARC